MDFPVIEFPDDMEVPGTSMKWGEVRARLRSFLSKQSTKVKQLITRLSAHGWFVSEEMDTRALSGLADETDMARIESQLTLYYRGCLDSTLSKLVTRFPNRKALLDSAFAAHRQGNYNASIPLLLAQADGICQDWLGVKLFSKTKGKGQPTTKSCIEDKVKTWPSGGILEAVISPLVSGSAFMLSEAEVGKLQPTDPSYGILNRHEILHGSSLDYGNETNSLKAISLLSYLQSLQARL